MQLPTFNSESLKKIKIKYVLAGLVLLILLIGGGVGMYLATKPQELRQQASGGYLDCAGGVKDGDKACSGFRQPVVCHNGAFTTISACAADEKCDAAASSGCTKTARACAGGVASGGKSCDSLHSYVTCNDGAFGTSTACAAGVICSNGICGGTGTGTTCAATVGDTTCQGLLPGAACQLPAAGGTTTKGSCTGNAGGACLCRAGGTGITPTPTTGGSCVGTVCTPPAGGCIAIHTCDQFDSEGHCTVLTPQVVTNATDAQQVANSTCKCVQVDVLNGQNNSCVNGHINGDISTLIGNSNVCPNNGCSTPTASPGTGGPGASVTPSSTPQASPQGSPQPSPTPGVSPSPVVSPTPGVSPSPVVSPTPGVSPIPTPSPTPVCGQSCTTTSQCPQDHTCNSGLCQLTACVNGATCSTDNCRVTACGGSCAQNADCPNYHSCVAGVCKLNTCQNGTSCSADACRVTGCGSSCSQNADCPNDHTCSGNTCKLTTCLNGTSCDSSLCSVLTPSPVPSPVLGCNDACVNNSDCKTSNHICVDTSTGRRCRLETNITSDSCSAPGQTVTQTTTQQPQKPATLPVAGSSDILKALGVGVLAIVLGVVGFLAL